MPASSSWMPYAPQGAKGIDDDDDITELLFEYGVKIYSVQKYLQNHAMFKDDLLLNYIMAAGRNTKSSSSSIGTTAHCEIWPVEQCPSIFSFLPPTLFIFSLPSLEDLFLLPLSILSRVFPFFSSLPVLE